MAVDLESDGGAFDKRWGGRRVDAETRFVDQDAGEGDGAGVFPSAEVLDHKDVGFPDEGGLKNDVLFFGYDDLFPGPECSGGIVTAAVYHYIGTGAGDKLLGVDELV